MEYRYRSAVTSGRTSNSSVEGLQVMTHPPLTIHPGEHGPPQKDRIEDLRIARVDQEVGAEVEKAASRALGERFEEGGLELAGERGDTRALGVMEEMVEDRGGVALTGRDLHDLGEASPLQVRHVPSEEPAFPATDETLDQLPSAPDRCHLREEPCEELLIVGRLEGAVLRDGWKVLEQQLRREV